MAMVSWDMKRIFSLYSLPERSIGEKLATHVPDINAVLIDEIRRKIQGREEAMTSLAMTGVPIGGTRKMPPLALAFVFSPLSVISSAAPRNAWNYTLWRVTNSYFARGDDLRDAIQDVIRDQGIDIEALNLTKTERASLKPSAYFTPAV